MEKKSEKIITSEDFLVAEKFLDELQKAMTESGSCLVSHRNLSQLSVRELAVICGRNNIHPIFKMLD